jgi:hypothetical protein
MTPTENDKELMVESQQVRNLLREYNQLISGKYLPAKREETI